MGFGQSNCLVAFIREKGEEGGDFLLAGNGLGFHGTALSYKTQTVNTQGRTFSSFTSLMNSHSAFLIWEGVRSCPLLTSSTKTLRVAGLTAGASASKITAPI